MKIEQSSVAMNAAHEYLHESEIEAENSFRMILAGASQSEPVASSEESDRLRLLVLLQNLVSCMLELLAGKQGARATNLADILQTGRAAPVPDDAVGTGRRIRMEWSVELTEIVREHESTAFSAAGTVRTADGKAIDFTLQLAMCRDYSCERSVRQSGSLELRDPLVVNFAGNAAELSGQRFEFDLDADGTGESIPGLSAGSAWLAFDRNGDGRINDGSELFGTRSGNGFADLACLDEDGNHWLDEADSAFSSLSLWEKDGAGKDTLSSLREKGIGAIYLGSAQTPFALADADNEKHGYIRASGVYLREDGGVGSVQQVDLAV
ncbi:MAG: hypothetical protein QMB52_09755 [Propionivibrio sp.]